MRSLQFIMACCLCHRLFLGHVLAGDPLDTWYWRNPLPQGNALNGICFGEGRYVAVGNLGTILISPDGRNWLAQESGTQTDLRDVAYGDGVYVAVGDIGAVLTSTDGRNWAEQYSPWFFNLRGIAWGNRQFVAVGDDTAILVSTNGADWELTAMGSLPLLDVAFGAGRFVALGGGAPASNVYGGSSSSSNIVMSSTDGRHWNRRELQTGALVGVGFGGGHFAAAASADYGVGLVNYTRTTLLYSEDGLQWDAAAQAFNYGGSAICASRDSFFCFAPYGNCLVSPTGEVWTNETTGPFSYIVAAASDGTSVVGVGSEYSRRSAMLVRDAAGHWENTARMAVSHGGPIYGLGGKFLQVYAYADAWAGPTTSVSVSSNGVLWTNLPVMTNGAYLAWVWNNGLFVAGGQNGRVAFSTNAENWTEVDSGFPDSYVSMAGGSDQFIAVASGNAIFQSTNGLDWSRQELDGATNLGAIAFGNGVFVAADQSSGSLFISPNGTDWTCHYQTNGWTFNTLGFWQDRFIGRDGAYNYHVSTDGVNWALLLAAQLGTPIYEVGWQDGQYVAVGGAYYPLSTSRLLTSQDGMNWRSHSPRMAGALRSLAFGNNTVLVTDTYGTVLQSAPWTNMPPQIATPPASLAVVPGRHVTLEATTIGTEPMVFTWFEDGTEIPGAHYPFLAVTNLVLGWSHSYSVTVSNVQGVATSEAARVTVGEPARLGAQTSPVQGVNFSGTPRLTYRVERTDGFNSGNLWQTITNITLSAPSAFVEDALPAAGHRFYRAVLLP